MELLEQENWQQQFLYSSINSATSNPRSGKLGMKNEDGVAADDDNDEQGEDLSIGASVLNDSTTLTYYHYCSLR